MLVTLDKDFGEIAIVYRRPHVGIVRLVGAPARQQAAACLRILRGHGEDLAKAAIITLSRGRLRVRLAD